MTLGEKISALRKQHEMSQGDLAEKMNVSRQSISKWETDTSVPELDKLIQLSEVFHITLDELVNNSILDTWLKFLRKILHQSFNAVYLDIQHRSFRAR